MTQLNTSQAHFAWNRMYACEACQPYSGCVRLVTRVASTIGGMFKDCAGRCCHILYIIYLYAATFRWLHCQTRSSTRCSTRYCSVSARFERSNERTNERTDGRTNGRSNIEHKHADERTNERKRRHFGQRAVVQWLYCGSTVEMISLRQQFLSN